MRSLATTELTTVGGGLSLEDGTPLDPNGSFGLGDSGAVVVGAGSIHAIDAGLVAIGGLAAATGLGISAAVVVPALVASYLVGSLIGTVINWATSDSKSWPPRVRSLDDSDRTT